MPGRDSEDTTSLEGYSGLFSLEGAEKTTYWNTNASKHQSVETSLLFDSDQESSGSSPCEQSLFYLFLSLSFISFISFLHTRKKEALHKSSPSFEVAVAPVLGLVIPVYSRQTGFSSASINFWEKPMVETEPAGSQ